MLETEITTDISWGNEASVALVYEYSVAVFCVQKQYDLEHGPITSFTSSRITPTMNTSMIQNPRASTSMGIPCTTVTSHSEI